MERIAKRALLTRILVWTLLFNIIGLLTLSKGEVNQLSIQELFFSLIILTLFGFLSGLIQFLANAKYSVKK